MPVTVARGPSPGRVGLAGSACEWKWADRGSKADPELVAEKRRAVSEESGSLARLVREWPRSISSNRLWASVMLVAGPSVSEQTWSLPRIDR